jgi:hypothetical protein
LPHIDDIEDYILKLAGNIFRCRVCGKVTNYCLDRLFGIWAEGKIAEIIFLD